jgi:hypothetical protein
MITPGTTLGSYRIERQLGRGGMGAVFLAYDTTLHRQVALKAVDEGDDGPASRDRLLREARNAAALNHPHICTVHEVRHDAGTTVIAMEYVERPFAPRPQTLQGVGCAGVVLGGAQGSAGTVVSPACRSRFGRSSNAAWRKIRRAAIRAPARFSAANIRLVLHSARRYEEAFAADQAWAASNPTTGGPEIAAALTRGHAEGGYRAAMRRAADIQAARASNNPRLGFIAAQFYVRAGGHDKALDWLEKGFESRETASIYISCSPIWDDLRVEPRFQALLRKMNLPS